MLAPWPWARLALLLVATGLRAQQQPAAPVPKPGTDAPIPLDEVAERSGLPMRRLSIEDALRIGRHNNVELRTAELLPEEADADRIGAEAIFDPELYGNVGYAQAKAPQRNLFQPANDTTTADATIGWRQRVVTGGLFDLAYRPTRFTAVSPSGAFPDRQYGSEWSVSYTQPLLRGGWTDYSLAPVRSARYRVSGARADFERTVQDTLLHIVQAYWELVFARDNYRVVTAALGVAREQLRITEERIRVRELAARDRVADEAEVARRQEDLIVAENDIRRREDDLRRLLFDDQQGELWRQNLLPTSEMQVAPRPEELPWQEYVTQAIEDRPDLHSLRSLVGAAQEDLLRAQRDLLPGLDLVGTYSSDGVDGSFGPAFSDSARQDFPDWGLRLQFTVPIGNQAAQSRKLHAELELERRQRGLYGAMMDVAKDVRDAVRNLQALAQSILASGESVRLAVTNLETEQVKLRVGASTAFEVQRRNQELQQARSRHLRNQLDYRVAQSRLLHVRGLLKVPTE
ncbi:MAG TPA: TolC family protein [Planctomycetota bacterium]|nr:TolC family protein [Planctomycetota bacterium]